MLEIQPTHAGADLTLADILMHLVAIHLAPMFLCVTGGDIDHARMAAIETVNAYRAQTHADLIAIAQIVAFGLGALGSLSLAMNDDISVGMTLRLRGNANACNRSAEQNRRALRQHRLETGSIEHARRECAPEPGQDAYEAEVIANVAATRQLVAETQAQMQAGNQAQPPAAPKAPAPAPAAAAPAPSPASVAAAPAAAALNIPTVAMPPVAMPPVAIPPAAIPPVAIPPVAMPPAAIPAVAMPPVAIPTGNIPTGNIPTTVISGKALISPAFPGPGTTEQQWQGIWAAAMADVAAEYTADIPNLSPKQRRAASLRAAALTSCANDLLTGNHAPGPRPGGLIRPG
jgi:hypothetical protein